MDQTIFSVIMLALCAFIYGAFIFYNKVIVPKRAEKKKKSNRISANEWTNVTDITNSAIFTRDGCAISVYQIDPINIELMTKKEKYDFVKDVSGSLSAIKTPYKLLSVPQPFDVQPYLEQLEQQKHGSNDVQKLIIANEIAYINSMVISGTMVEKRYYVITWSSAADDYVREREDFFSRWHENKRISMELLKDQELIQLCNLIFNPSVSDEIYDITHAALPTINT